MKAVSARIAIRAAAAALTAGLLAAGLATVPAMAATTTSTAAQAAATVQTTPAHPAASTTRQALLAEQARMAARSAASNRSGTIFGTVVGPYGRPLAGACVAAIGAGRSLTVTAESDGQFVLNSLRPGRYVLEYRDCAAPAKYLARWSGGVSLRSAATALTIGTGQVRHVPGMMLLPVHAAAMLPDRASFDSMVAHADGRGLTPAAAAAATGRITGLVTGGGKKLSGICVVAFPTGNGEGYAATTTKNGTYTIRRMAPGQYYVYFAYEGCPGNSNWLQQAYPDGNSPFANGGVVAVSASHTTSGIDGDLRLGGQISGTVTSAASRQKLKGICVNAIGTVPGGSIGTTIETNGRGGYVLHALFPGKYAVSSNIGCGSSGNYAPATHKAIKIRYGQVVAGVNMAMRTGAEVTGKVTAVTSSGQPLAGMCVFANNASFSITGTASTDSAGTYEVVGLGSGTYQLEFLPGCNNNANYVPAFATVHTTEGKVTRGVNAALQVGGTISGTVTNTSDNPVPEICTFLAGTSTGNIEESTASNGSYSIDQLPAGTYEIGFEGGCGNTGSYAPYFYNDQDNPALATPIVLATAGTQTVNAVLQPGATITGKVTSASGAALANTCVYAATPGQVQLGIGEVSALTGSGKGGTYTIANLAPGQYLMDFGCGSSGKYADQWFNQAPDAGQADVVSAAAGTTSGINAVLQPGGTISGTVTSSAGHPLAGICVAAFATADKTSMFQIIGGGGPGSVQTDGRGGYTISGLAAGRYHVGFVPCILGSPYQQQWYRSQPSQLSATAVSVKAGATTSGINGRLAIGGTISGRVDTPAGKPLRNVCVEALDLAKGYGGIAFTGKTGTYTITGLNSATYTVEFAPCGSAENRVSVLSTARVTAPKATTGVNADLGPGGSLSGTLTAATSSAAVQGECVEVISSSPTNPGGIGYSGLHGTYTVTGLAKGTYQVFVADPECLDSPSDLAPQWYDNQPTQAGASPVSVSVGATTPDINAALQLDGEITGTVSGPSVAALSGVCVTAVPVSGYALTDGVLPVVAVTSASGYTLENLLPGQYKVEFSSGCGASGYATQWWQDASSEATAAALTVNAGQDEAGINAVLTG